MGADGTKHFGYGRCPAPLTPWELWWESSPRAQGHQEGDIGQWFGSSSALLVGWRKLGTEGERRDGKEHLAS